MSATVTPSLAPLKSDAEITQMRVILRALQKLGTNEARIRVLCYLLKRLGMTATSLY